MIPSENVEINFIFPFMNKNTLHYPRISSVPPEFISHGNYVPHKIIR